MNTIISNEHFAHLLLFSVQLSFSGWHILGSLAMQNRADPFVFVLYRMILGTSVMCCIIKWNGQNFSSLEQVDYIRVFMLGVFVYISFTVLVLQYVSASRLAIFQPSIPCIASMISVLSGFEQFSLIKALSILLAVSGAYLAESSTPESSHQSLNRKNAYFGTFLLCIQVLATACLQVYLKPVLKKYKPLFITTLYFIVGTFLTICLCIPIISLDFYIERLYFDKSTICWIALFYSVFGASLYNFTGFALAGKYLTPSVVTLYYTFQPVGTITLSYLVFNTVISLQEATGAVLIIVGLFISIYQSATGNTEQIDNRVDNVEYNKVNQFDDKNDVELELI